MTASIVTFDPQRDSYEELTRLLNAAYADLAGAGFNYVAATQNAEMTRNRIVKSTATWIARCDDRIAGIVSYYDCATFRGGEPQWYRRPHHSIFAQFAVDVALRGTGLGTKLLKTAEDRALADGKSELACDTADGADHLTAYYLRHGFRIVGEHRYQRATYASHIFSKRLGIQVRRANDADLHGILALSRTTPCNKDAYLRRQLENGCIDVACENGAIVGFIAWNREFFSKPFVWLAAVDPVKRRGGIGALLFANVERLCKGDRLYSSTNASNGAMHRFFERRGYRFAGEAELDPGDPEVFYYLDL
jgi:GNAT superfamily N-acetyltransferase